MSEEFPAEAGTLPVGFAPGSRVAGYKLEEQIGAGGMGVVFRARDERLQRRVALKILAPALAADEAFRHRFIRESRAAAAVDDPHIIPVFEAGEADGVLFIAMRYVPGGDVRTLIRQTGPLSPERALAIISPMASALDAAHSAGLVHRDVKPANMLLDARPGRPDHVYLSDFGLSKGVVTSVWSTRSGQFLGTPGYSAPEQIEGKPVDGRADQYSLACAAFEFLCGETPFPRDQVAAMIWAHMSEPPPALTSRRPGLPPAVDSVLARALAKPPADRYASCREFADLLREALGFAPYDPGSGGIHQVGNPAPSPAQHPPTIAILERPRPEPVIETLSDSDAVSVGNRPDARPGSARELSGIVVAPTDVTAVALPNLPSPAPEPGIYSDHDTISAQPAQHDERTLADPGRRRVLVGLAAAAVAGLAAAGWEIRHLAGGSRPVTKSTPPASVQTVRAGTLVWRFAAGAGIGSRPAISTGVVYFASDDDNVYAVDARHGTKLWSFRTGGPVASSPAVVDGVVYIGSQDSNVYALNAGNGTKLWEVPTGGQIDSSPAVSGGAAYIGSGDDSIYAVSAQGTKLSSFTTRGFVDSSPAITGGTIYAASDDGYVYALSASNLADVIWSYDTGGPVPFSSPTVSGGVVYIGSHDDNVYALTADHGTKLWSFPTGGPIDSSAAVAAGVVYIGSDDRNLYALAADDGKKLWSFPTSGHVFSSPAVAAGVVYVGSDDHHLYALRT